MTRRGAPLALVLLLAVSAFASAPVTPPTAAMLGDAVRTLAAPEMEGRGSGTPGGERAARQIAEWLAAAGLRPGGDGGTFFQSFPIASGTVVAPSSALDLVAPVTTRFELERDWRPHGGSLATEVSGDVVFVSYGIVMPDGTRDDYAGVDVKDRIALALDGAPRGAALTAATRLEKLVAARRRGAAALLLVSDTLPAVASTTTSARMVSASVTRRTADALLAPMTLERATAAGSRAFATGTRARITVALGREERHANNVIGVLPGTDPTLSGETVVVGAHYDHLGVVNGAIHPGADDNASGTAVVVGLAKSFAAAGGTPRTLVFTLFSAEEMGLLGSRHYVGAPTTAIERTVAMVNLDMVGRLRDGQLHIAGVDSGTGLRQVVTDATRGAGVTATLHGTPYGPSDHMRFYRRGTPVLFFNTGGHDEYHKPTDTADRINADGMARVATVAARVVESLATGPRASYVTLFPEQREQASGAGAFLGIVVENQGVGDGVRLADVLPGTAAGRGGLREGDVIMRFAHTSLASFDDLRTVLKTRKPGDRVELMVLRDGEDRIVSVTLDTRP